MTILLLLWWASFSVPAKAQEASLQGIRCDSRSDGLQVRLRFDAPVQASDVSTDEACRLQFEGLQVDPALQASMSVPDPLLPLLTWQASSTLVIPWRYRMPVSMQWTTPTHLKLTFQKHFDVESTRSIAPGLEYDAIWRGTSKGPLRIYVLRMNPRQSGLRLAPVLAQSSQGFSRETVRHMVERTGAIAGINGAYFGSNGQPAGLVQIDGQLISGPYHDRTALLLGKTPRIERMDTSAYLELPDRQKVEVDGFNSTLWPDRLVIYTDRWGERTPPESSGSLEIAIDSHGIACDRAAGNLPIPPGGFVISASGLQARWLAAALPPGASAHLEETRKGPQTCLGAGPQLLDHGKIAVTARLEGFPPDIAIGHAPRSAIGITDDGQILLVAVDGRDRRRSIGMTLAELAGLMKELGAKEAMNLDGGGSTTFVVEGKTVNHPSDGCDRAVSNGLLIWKSSL